MIRFASRRVATRLFFVSVMLALPVAVFAQEATINGTITDSTGAVLPGVSVVAVHAASGNTFEAVTNERGAFRIAVRAGVYQISAMLPGFGTVMRREIELLQPELMIPVGKLAIEQFLPSVPMLTELIGKIVRVEKFGHAFDLVPLPHPSGVSPWHRIEPGRSLTRQALALIRNHPAWGGLSAE